MSETTTCESSRTLLVTDYNWNVRRRRRGKNGRRAWKKSVSSIQYSLKHNFFSFSFIRDFVQKTFSTSIFRTVGRSLACMKIYINLTTFFFGVCDDIFCFYFFALRLQNSSLGLWVRCKWVHSCRLAGRSEKIAFADSDIHTDFIDYPLAPTPFLRVLVW